MHNLELDIMGRFALLELLPKEGNFMELQMGDEIRGKVNFSVDEMKRYNIKNSDNGGISWNIETQEKVKFEFRDMEMDFLRDQITKLDNEKKIRRDFLESYSEVKNSVEDKDESVTKGS